RLRTRYIHVKVGWRVRLPELLRTTFCCNEVFGYLFWSRQFLFTQSLEARRRHACWLPVSQHLFSVGVLPVALAHARDAPYLSGLDLPARTWDYVVPRYMPFFQETVSGPVVSPTQYNPVLRLQAHQPLHLITNCSKVRKGAEHVCVLQLLPIRTIEGPLTEESSASRLQIDPSICPPTATPLVVWRLDNRTSESKRLASIIAANGSRRIVVFTTNTNRGPVTEIEESLAHSPKTGAGFVLVRVTEHEYRNATLLWKALLSRVFPRFAQETVFKLGLDPKLRDDPVPAQRVVTVPTICSEPSARILRRGVRYHLITNDGRFATKDILLKFRHHGYCIDGVTEIAREQG
ncbi:unnamed protein product, partial [Amoebophrya sp. A25]